MAQDAYPGEFWLDYGLDTLKKSQAGLLAFSDGRFFGKLATFGLADRHWLNTLYGNALFYSEYTRHFGDTELSVIAMSMKKLVFNPHCILKEVDYDKHARPLDHNDAALYRQHAASGFEGRIAPFTPD